MTGNNKFWRASLAGLASVAMLATMGVTALTASAAAAGNYTVTVDKQAVTVWPGETLADAVVRNNVTLNNTEAGFVGYYLNGEAVNFNDPKAITGDVTLKAEKTADFVPVTFKLTADSAQVFNGVKEDGDVTLNVRKGESLGVARGPVDWPNQRVVKSWTITETDDQGKTTDIKDQTLEDVENYNVASAKSITVTPQTVEKSGYVRFVQPSDWKNVAHLSGAFSDRSANNDEYVADAQAGTEVQAPSYVFDATTTAKFSYLAGWQTNGGTQYAADAKVKAVEGELRLEAVSPTTGVVVKFNSNGGSAVAPQYVNEKGTVTKPADPTKKNYKFLGWKVADADRTKVVETAKDSISNENYILAFDGVTFKDSVTLEAEWVPSYQIRVTFHYGDYPNAPKDESTLYAPTDYVTAPATPTREGFVFDGWYTDAALTTNFDFDLTLVANGVKGGSYNNFVLYAGWKRVYNNDAKTALNYVQDGTDFPDAEHDYKYTTVKDESGKDKIVKEDLGPQNDASYFTDASFKEFKATYLKAVRAYQAAKQTAPNGEIDETTSAAIVSDLTAAWKKLVFKNDSGTPAYRFYNRVTNEHLFTTNLTEVDILKGNPDWSYEGIGFNVLNNGETSFTKFAPSSLPSDVLKSSAIVTTVYRLYNRVTNEHLFTNSAAERDTLVGGDWSYESEFYGPVFSSTKNVYRLYNPILNQHLFTQNKAEVDQTTAGDWKLEGVVFKAL